MKNLKNTIALFITIVCFGTSMAQQNENSLLWKVEGNGIKTSYVFGTFHMLPKESFVFKDKVKNAFNATELTVLELDMDEPTFQTEMLQQSVIPDGKVLTQFMEKEEVATLNTYLQEKLGASLDQFKTLKPLMVSSMIMMTNMGTELASYEGTLIQLSQEGQKEVKGLETVASQMAVLDQQPYDEQIDDILELIANDSEMEEILNKMITLYTSENIDGLYGYMDEYFNNDILQMDRMLHNRNKNWISKIGEYAKEQATFYGVGAGHLGGALGVINLLREAGYTVTPVLE